MMRIHVERLLAGGLPLGEIPLNLNSILMASRAERIGAVRESPTLRTFTVCPAEGIWTAASDVRVVVPLTLACLERRCRRRGRMTAAHLSVRCSP